MNDIEFLEELNQKRGEVLQEIKPIMEAFNIADYDYIVSTVGQTETLKIGDVHIGCSCNSIFAIKQELVGYLFLSYWRERNLGNGDLKTRKEIKRYWINNVNKGVGGIEK